MIGTTLVVATVVGDGYPGELNAIVALLDVFGQAVEVMTILPVSDEEVTE